MASVATSSEPPSVSVAAGETRTDGEPKVNPEPRVVRLSAVAVTPESFAPYGTVVLPSEDGAEFGEADAELDLTKGRPRVYIMRLRDRKLAFDRITHHASVTQCLGAVGQGPWYLGVVASTVLDSDASDSTDGSVRWSKAGHWYTPPRPEDVVVFRVDGPAVLKLHAGTWHAGPLFTDPAMDFFNLELADTNVVDHTTHIFAEDDGVIFEFEG